MISAVVYLLCALTSILCAVLLSYSYFRGKVRLLLWSALCFLGLAINNILLFVDLVITPEIDLSVIRTIPAALGVVVLIWGLVWDLP